LKIKNYPKFDVISIGSATVDIFVKSDAISVEKNLPYDLIYLPKSSKNDIKQSLIQSGGGATNSSVSFSRLGLKAACCTLFGSDELGSFIIRDLKINQVSDKFLVQPQNEKTDFSIILVTDDGSRTILTQRGPTRLEKHHIDWSKLKSNWFYISSLEGNLNLLENLIGFATENNIKIALNPGNRELNQPILKSLLPYIDFLLLNRQEASILTNLSPDDSNFFNKLKQIKSRIIAITNGHQGAHIFTQNQSLFTPAINIIPVDETGAGDAFGSTFVSGLIMQKNLNTCLDMAIKNSASVVSHLGAKTGLITKSKLIR